MFSLHFFTFFNVVHFFFFVHVYEIIYKYLCKIGSKILIVTGDPLDNGINMEIVDVEDSSFTCQFEAFPVRLYGATGGLINGLPFLCGGVYDDDPYISNDCYKMTGAGSWTKDETASLNTGRLFAGTGSVVIENQLILSGGVGEPGILNSIEMVSPDTVASTPSVELPTGFLGHCLVKWDESTVMVIGGVDVLQETQVHRTETLLIDVVSNTWSAGPILNTGRSLHACGEIEIMGTPYIVVSGGIFVDDYRISTEILEKDNVENGWQTSKHRKLFLTTCLLDISLYFRN